MRLLWHGSGGEGEVPAEPIGICIFTSPPLGLRERNRYFGLSGRWSRTKIQTMNRQLVSLARVVVHPAYRGAGIAAAFIRRSCASLPWPWIETLAQMGHMNPFFEKAGFVRVGVAGKTKRSRTCHSALYGGRRSKYGGSRLVSRETFEKSLHARPVYYVFDNRADSGRRERKPTEE